MKEREELYSKLRNQGFLTSGQCSDVIFEIQEHLDVDRLAQFIRQIDGNNKLGAGQLAEKIVEFLRQDLQ